MLSVLVPAASAMFAGNVALASLDVTPTVWVTELTRFQFASTAFTVTVNAVPAVRAVGVPVLPVAVPGAAVSPGISICSFVNAPAVTVVAGLVFAVFVPSVTSVAVTVRLPAVSSVTVNVCVPATSAAFAGNCAFASLEVMRTVSVMVLTHIPVRVDRVHRHRERHRRRPGGGSAGLARRRPGRRGLARHQELQLRERSRVDRGRRARVRGLRAVGDVCRRHRVTCLPSSA